MVTSGLKYLLEGLDLISNEAVFFRNEEDGKIFTSFSVETLKKLDIIKPDASFVFNNQPYVLFFDLTNNANGQRENEIHKQIWSFDYSPIIFIVKDSEIQIFNAFSFEKKSNRLQEIKISEQERNMRFSFWNLQSGESWRWLQAEYYGAAIQKKRVNQKLFENIRLVRQILTSTEGIYSLVEDEANILILRLIFIRYLIDRNVRIDDYFISGKTIEEKRQSFIELVKKPRKLNQFFEQLNNKFNGVLFKDRPVQLNKEQAVRLSWIFSGIPDPGQPNLFEDFYFDIFDFSIIQVEVISGIYESLINPETRNEQSAVYTPSFLVEYILTNTVDKFLTENHTSECKVFDPSCGSGIFLVQSFRRMVDKEKLLYGNKIKKTRLKEIARKNLFGIDVNRQALKVTCFSLYIAILDYQDPKTILDNFHFPKLLDENFFEANFFDTIGAFNNTINSEQPHFILGNPPWKSNKDEIHLKWLKENNKITGRYEIAQSFLLRSKDFMQFSTTTALIVTSTIFYNVSKTTKQFKRDFLTQFCLDRFFDLSPVRRLIFEEKDSPAAIVYYRLSDGQNHISNLVHHQSVKWNIFLKYYKTLIVEKFDQKQIEQKYFIENDWMFKVALYGGILDLHLFNKILSGRKKIDDIIDNKSVLFKGSGIKENPITDTFPFLVGLPLLQNSEIEQFFTPSFKGATITEKDIALQSGRRKVLFQGSQVLLKAQTENESEIVVSFTQSSYVFKHDVFGISTTKDEKLLLVIYCLLLSRLNTYYQFLSNCSWGIATRPAIRLEEYLSFPFPNLAPVQTEHLVSLAGELLSSFREHFKEFNMGLPADIHPALKQISSAVDQIFGIQGYERDIIDYVLDISRYQFQSSEHKQQKIIRRINNDEALLRCYVDVFIQELQSIYEDEHISVEVYNLDCFIAMNFIFSEKTVSTNVRHDNLVFISQNSDEKEILQRIASNVSISKFMSSTDPTKNIYIQKDIKGFEENSFYIIKPNEYKCWHRAMAWYDVAEIKEVIEQAELTHLKNSKEIQ